MDLRDKPEGEKQQPDVEASPDARLEKIARIKKALEDGTYHVSSEDVARKLIDHMLDPKS